MYNVTIKHRKGHKTYTVYTEDEAKSADIQYKHWRDVQVGEYGVTDDGRVSQCYGVLGPYRDTDVVFVQYPIGCSWTSADKFIAKGRLSIHTSSGRPEMEHELGRSKTKEIVRLVARKMPIAKAVSEIIQPRDRGEYDRWMRVTRTREFKKAVNEERQEVFAKCGITDESLAKEWVKLKEDTEEGGKISDGERLKLRRGILQDLSNYKGWSRDDRVKLKQEQIEGVFDSKMIGEIMRIRGESTEAEGSVDQLKPTKKP